MSYDFSMSYKVLLWHHISDGNSACPLCSVFQTPMDVCVSGCVSVLRTSTHPVIKVSSSRRRQTHRLKDGISITMYGEMTQTILHVRGYAETKCVWKTLRVWRWQETVDRSKTHY